MLLGDPGRQVAKLISADEKAIRRGIARTLTRAAGIAQDTLIAKEQSTFWSASRFMTMTQGYRIETATPSQDNPTAAFRAKDRQTRVLQFSAVGEHRATQAHRKSRCSFLAITPRALLRAAYRSA